MRCAVNHSDISVQRTYIYKKATGLGWPGSALTQTEQTLMGISLRGSVSLLSQTLGAGTVVSSTAR